ncbi:MAG: DNA polymerase/3'-5' exonuclease PolX, partial [archaeon]
SPERLDLNDFLILKAKKYGVNFAIDTDAHAKENLDFMKYGVGIARRGWLEKKEVINTYPYKKFKNILNKKL